VARPAPARTTPGGMRGFVGGLFVVAAVLALWALSLMVGREGEIMRFAAQGWDKAQILNTNLTFDTRLAAEGFCGLSATLCARSPRPRSSSPTRSARSGTRPS